MFTEMELELAPRWELHIHAVGKQLALQHPVSSGSSLGLKLRAQSIMLAQLEAQ